MSNIDHPNADDFFILKLSYFRSVRLFWETMYNAVAAWKWVRYFKWTCETSEPSIYSNLYCLVTSDLTILKSSNTLESIYPRPAFRGIILEFVRGGVLGLFKIPNPLAF